MSRSSRGAVRERSRSGAVFTLHALDQRVRRQMPEARLLPRVEQHRLLVVRPEPRHEHEQGPRIKSALPRGRAEEAVYGRSQGRVVRLFEDRQRPVRLGHARAQLVRHDQQVADHPAPGGNERVRLGAVGRVELPYRPHFRRHRERLDGLLLEVVREHRHQLGRRHLDVVLVLAVAELGGGVRVGRGAALGGNGVSLGHPSAATVPLGPA